MDQNNEEVNELMSIFIKMVPTMLDEMLSYVGNGNWKAASNVAHKLKSSMRLWDISSLDEDAVFIETYGLQEEQTDEVKRRVMHLSEQLMRVIEEMKVELS